jgi:hypothetical protein
MITGFPGNVHPLPGYCPPSAPTPWSIDTIDGMKGPARLVSAAWRLKVVEHCIVDNVVHDGHIRNSFVKF